MTELRVHEATIQRGIHSLAEVGAALGAIRDKRLYRVEYPTFEEYCQQRWGWSRAHAYRMIDFAEIRANLSPRGDIIPEHEKQARPLTVLKPADQHEVWQRAVETAPEGKVTASHVAAVVRDFRSQPESKGGVSSPPEEPRPSGRLPSRVYVIESCEDPLGRLALFNPEQFGQPILRKDFRVLRDEDDVREAISLHTTHWDTPFNTEASVSDLVAEVASGRQVVQFVIELPGDTGPNVVRERVPEGTLVCGRFMLSALLGHDSHGLVTRAMERGHVAVMEANHHSQTERFVILGTRSGPDARAVPWLQMHQRYVDIMALHAAQDRHNAARHFTISNVAAAIHDQRIAGRVIDGRMEVHIGWSFLQWAVSQWGELSRIIQAQVTR